MRAQVVYVPAVPVCAHKHTYVHTHTYAHTCKYGYMQVQKQEHQKHITLQAQPPAQGCPIVMPDYLFALLALI